MHLKSTVASSLAETGRKRRQPASAAQFLVLTAARTHNGHDFTADSPAGPMPTTIRLIAIMLIAAALVYAAMLALVTFVKPRPTQMEIRIPAERLNPDKP
jgi:hypothetical protein